MSVTAFIALGSNLGDRRQYLTQALEALRQHPGITVTRVSSFYETAPVGGPPGQPNYLNGAAELTTDLEPRELLQALLEIETRLGRVRLEPQGPRTVDLDLLLYGDRIIDEPDLIVPHPRMRERTFVLQPLAEIAPRAVHPGLGVTVGELLQKEGARDEGRGAVRSEEGGVRSEEEGVRSEEGTTADQPDSSLLTPHSSLLTPHSSLLTPHSSLLTPLLKTWPACAPW